MIDKWLINKLKQEKEKRGLYIPKGINASGIYKCPREIYFRMKGYEPEKKETQWFT